MAKKENRIKKWRPGPPEVYSDTPIFYRDDGKAYDANGKLIKENTKTKKRKK